MLVSYVGLLHGWKGQCSELKNLSTQRSLDLEESWCRGIIHGVSLSKLYDMGSKSSPRVGEQ